jgi:hypothetical protein
MPVIFPLAIIAILSGAALTAFALLVIGIRKSDRGHLSNAPRTNSEAFARCCLIGIRGGSNREADE